MIIPISILLIFSHFFVSFRMTGSRIPKQEVLDYCFHPRKLLKDGEYIYVPCGKCDGCILHSCNSWSSRLSNEIMANPFSIFFTLTYNNKYLPTLVADRNCLDLSRSYTYYSDHPLNIRYDGNKDVLRDDRIIIKGSSDSFFVPIQNDGRVRTVNYGSKRDIQLWLKLVRKSINENLNIQYSYGINNIRYYIISEIGPRTCRAHFHGIIFARCKEVAEFLLDEALFKNWKMCDSVLFKQHCSYCSPGTSTYIANYVAGNSKLPSIYQDSAIKPFRLSSKKPAIGYSAFDKKEVFEKISQGIITYTRQKSRADQSDLLGYPSSYMRTLFPKCYRFAQLSFNRLLEVYGIIFREVVGSRRPYILVSQRLREDLHSSDFQAAKACYDFCIEYGAVPFHYVYLLDQYYYLSAMHALKDWYEWQEKNSNNLLLILSSYKNLTDYVSQKSYLSSYQISRMVTFFDDFMIDFLSLDLSDLHKFVYLASSDLSYRQQVSDIVDNLDKSKKVNELANTSPHII